MLFSVLFPDCIGLSPPTYSSAPGNSDYKNFTLKFYKSDDIMIVLHHLKGQFSFSFFFALISLCVCFPLQADQCHSWLSAEGHQHSDHHKQWNPWLLHFCYHGEPSPLVLNSLHHSTAQVEICHYSAALYRKCYFFFFCKFYVKMSKTLRWKLFNFKVITLNCKDFHTHRLHIFTLFLVAIRSSWITWHTAVKLRSVCRTRPP